MATTSNYSWPTPDDSDDARDGAAAIRALGSAIDQTVFDASAAAAPLLFVEKSASADYTIDVSDVSKVVAISNATSAVTITVPTDSAQPIPLGAVVNVYRNTSETVTIVGDSGVTVRNAGAIANEYGEVSLRKRGANEWVMIGEITP